MPALLNAALLQWLEGMAAQGILTTDRALVIRGWNRWLETHTGFTGEQMIGQPLLTAFPELVTRGFEPHYRAALSGQSRFFTHTFHRYLIPGRIAAGGEIAQNARLVPLSIDGTVVGTLTVIEDVSDRVASERELRSQIESANLARNAAEEASRVKEEFLTTLSHEIRTPLNAVVGWTKILLGRPVVEPAMLARALQVIDRNALAQMRLIDDMLDMARVMSGKLRLELRPVDLASIAFAAIDVVTPTAAAKRITVRSLIETDEPWVLGDPDRLQQVVWNLLSNSIKFTEPGGTVTVEISPVRDSVQLKVTDTGAGIAADFLPLMFERFRQQDASANRRHGGLGLGLSLVRQLVELHGGTVMAESAVGIGTTISVTLPSHHPVAMTGGDMPALDVDISSLAGVRVLLVEDKDDALEILTAALQQMGMTVKEARSAGEALARLDEARAVGALPDIIISDIGLPDEDGYRLMQKLSLRDAMSGGDIPVIAVTAYGRPEDRARALAAGFRQHLTKPVAPTVLGTAILRVLNEDSRSPRRKTPQ
jgi:PAS domain S-box-containing protein